VRVIPRDEETSDLRAETTAEQRIAMVWELTLAAWELRGERVPDYPRAETPVVLRSLRSS